MLEKDLIINFQVHTRYFYKQHVIKTVTQNFSSIVEKLILNLIKKVRDIVEFKNLLTNCHLHTCHTETKIQS